MIEFNTIREEFASSFQSFLSDFAKQRGIASFNVKNLEEHSRCYFEEFVTNVVCLGYDIWPSEIAE